MLRSTRDRALNAKLERFFLLELDVKGTFVYHLVYYTYDYYEFPESMGIYSTMALAKNAYKVRCPTPKDRECAPLYTKDHLSRKGSEEIHYFIHKVKLDQPPELTK